MKAIQSKSSTPFIIISIIFVIIGIWGTVRLSERPGIKAILEKSNSHLSVIQLTPGSNAARLGLKEGDIVLKIDNHPVDNNTDLNFYLEQKEIGELINLTLRRGEKTIDLTMPVERKYSWMFIVINSLAGFFLWAIGVFVFLKGPQSQVTRIFLLSSLSLSLALFISWEGFPYGPKAINFILPSIHIIAYTLIPALFLHFSILFPGEEEVSTQAKPIIYSVYLPSLVLILMMEVFYWKAVSTNLLMVFRVYKTLYLYFRVYLVVYVLFGLFILYQTHRKLEFLEDKRKIKWIFWGIVVGTFPFVFLHTLPDVLFGRTVVPEVVNYLFILLIPVSFAFSILRYQVMDIDVVINRSLVYSILTGFIVSIYLLVVVILGEVLYRLTGYQGSLFLILATLVVALLFTTVKNRIRVLVDKTFYRVRYDYRKAIQKFTRQVILSYSQRELFKLLLRKVDLLFAVNCALLFIREDDLGEFKIAKSFGFSEEEIEEIIGQRNNLIPEISRTKKIQGMKGSTTFREIVSLPENPVLKKYEIRLSFPLTEKGELFGLLLMGKKKSEIRYSLEDVELVSLMVQEIAQALQNIKMRQRIIEEELEKEKLEELNKLKSKFISNVSHDLRTPLTAIRFSVDNMLKGVCGNLSDESLNYLKMIKVSTLHVSRMIDNLLTLSMSESGRITLNQERLSLSQAADEAYSMLKVMAEKKNINMVKEVDDEIHVYADKRGILQIFMNLLDNSIKNTEPGGKISISAKTKKDQNLAEISIEDDGIGIPSEKLERIFERFQKLAPETRAEDKGLGIGLDIVRSLVRLHGGNIKVESPVRDTDRGAKFTFTLPLS